MAFNGQPTYKQHGLELGVNRATAEGLSLATKRISPHTLRHAKAIDLHLLRSGVPFNAINRLGS
jgi:site-specific recombinase XerD